MVSRIRQLLVWLVVPLLAVSALLVAKEHVAVVDNLDYLRTPAASAAKSRWYSLAELGIAREDLREATNGIAGDAYTNALDLRDQTCFPGLTLITDQQTLTNTETWEDGLGPGKDRVGYPSVVHNTHGANPDGKFYLFYAIHDPYSGIAAATAETLDGPWTKVGPGGVSQPDSRVLRAPRRPRTTSHFSSPVVTWNESEKLWFMYFHFYSNEWEKGGGHQRTALATSRELAARDWTPWVDADGKLIAVMPVVKQRWMNSQSTYHAIYKLPGRYWLAFLRGVGGQYSKGNAWQQDPAQLGMAVSTDGRRWAELPGNPLIHQRDGRGGKAGVYRPEFIALLRDQFLLSWAESDYYDANPTPVAGVSTDLIRVTPTQVGFGDWRPADGAASTWRQGDVVHFFYGDRHRSYRLSPSCPAASPEK
jgi:hypothetical protein